VSGQLDTIPESSAAVHVDLAAAPARSCSREGGSLCCTEISVAFGDTVVLDGVCLELHRGEVHVLIGPNGAGKTTLANVISGHVVAQSGTVTLDGVPLSGPPHRRARRGLGRKFQIPRVFPRLSACEQLALAAPAADLNHLGEQLAELGDTQGSDLSHGWRQWLELQMVLLQRPSVVVLDEPTSGLPRSERTKLAEAIDAVPYGTFLLVEHDLDFVARIADRVSFLHNGRLLRTGSFQELSRDSVVQSAYMGSAVDEH
jgi:urea transport system ATP-binding protein